MKNKKELKEYIDDTFIVNDYRRMPWYQKIFTSYFWNNIRSHFNYYKNYLLKGNPKFPLSSNWISSDSLPPLSDKIGVYKNIALGTLIGNPSCKKCKGSGHLPLSNLYRGWVHISQHLPYKCMRTFKFCKCVTLKIE